MNVSHNKTFTEEKLRELVMSFNSGCKEGKVKFLQENGIAPARVQKSYTVIFEWDEGISSFHDDSCKTIERAIAKGLVEDHYGYGQMLEEKHVTVKVRNP